MAATVKFTHYLEDDTELSVVAKIHPGSVETRECPGSDPEPEILTVTALGSPFNIEGVTVSVPCGFPIGSRREVTLEERLKEAAMEEEAEQEGRDPE